jgi:hypothetical protein
MILMLQNGEYAAPQFKAIHKLREISDQPWFCQQYYVTWYDLLLHAAGTGQHSVP